MPILVNPVTGEVGISDDPTGALQQGWRIATDDEADAYARELDFGTVGQQAQAQAERVVRGATLGAVEGFGDAEDIRARAEVSEELSPVTSAVASVVPDVGVALLTGGLGGLATGAGRAAGRAALAEGAGIVRAGLAAGRAGGAAALAAESAGTGLVAAGQQAYAEERTFADDPGRFAEDALIWGGLNFGLGAALGQLGGRGARVADEAPAPVGADELDDIAAAAEVRAGSALPEESIPGVPGQVFDVEGPAPGAAAPAEADPGLTPRVQELIQRIRARESQAGMVDLGASLDRPRTIPVVAEHMGLSEGELRAFMAENGVLSGKRDTVVAAELHQLPAFQEFISAKSIERYTENSAYMVNRKLRSAGWDKSWAYPGASAPERRYYEGLKGIAKRAAEVMRSSSDNTAPIFRGTAVDAKTLRAWEKAGEVRDTAFMSFSTDEGVARRFIPGESFEGQFASDGTERVLLRSDGGGHAYGGPEREVMFAPDTPLSIRSITREGDLTVIDVSPRPLPPPTPQQAQAIGALRASNAEAGNVILGAPSAAGLAASPMGNVIAAGAGAAAGGAIGGDTESIAAGGALGLAISMLAGRGARRAMAGAVRQGEREAVDEGVERALRRASKADADDIVQRAIGKAPEREADSLGRQRRLYINRDAIFEAAERELSQDVTRLVKDVGQVARVEKLTAVASEVSENLPAQRAVADRVSKDAAKFAGELRAEAKAYAAASGKQGMQYAIPGQKGWTLALMDHAKEIQKAKTGRALFEALDGFKRSAQEFKLSLETGALNSANPIHHQRLIPRIDSFARDIRAALEDSATWGKAGEKQRAYNAVISDRLMPSMRIFEEAVMQRTHRGYDGVWNLEGWETKARALLKGTDPGNRRHVAAVLDGMDELASVRRKFGDAKTAERIEAQTAKVRRTIGLADEVHDASERMRALGELAGAVPLLGGTARAAAVGDLTAAWQRLTGASEAAAQRGVDDWIRSSRARGARGGRRWTPELTPEQKQVRDVALKRGLSQTMALFQGDDESPGAAFERWRDALVDQETFFSELGEDYGALQQEAPEVFMALAARADLARRFLLERLPPAVGVSLANPDGFPPNADAIEDWAQYVNAVRFPTRVIENLAGISVQEVETIRAIAPRLYEQTQLRLLEGIARAQQSGEPLDDSFLQRMAILFPELDGAGSPVFSREFGQAIRDHNELLRHMRAEAGQRGGGSRRPQRPSPLQATIENGATFGTLG